MSAGKLGGGPQMMDMRYRGPEEFPGFIDDMQQKTLPDVEPSPPGYQQPPGGVVQTGGLITPIFNQIGGRLVDSLFGPRQDNQQYYKQMRQNIDGMNEALKQIEGISTPGGQYQGGGGNAGGKTGKGTANF